MIKNEINKNEIKYKISRVEEEAERYSGKLKLHVAWFFYGSASGGMLLEQKDTRLF